MAGWYGRPLQRTPHPLPHPPEARCCCCCCCCYSCCCRRLCTRPPGEPRPTIRHSSQFLVLLGVVLTVAGGFGLMLTKVATWPLLFLIGHLVWAAFLPLSLSLLRAKPASHEAAMRCPDLHCDAMRCHALCCRCVCLRVCRWCAGRLYLQSGPKNTERGDGEWAVGYGGYHPDERPESRDKLEARLQLELTAYCCPSGSVSIPDTQTKKKLCRSPWHRRRNCAVPPTMKPRRCAS